MVLSVVSINIGGKMYTQEDYKIPKVKKQVQVYLNDSSKYSLKFIFFLNERSRYGDSIEGIEEFLNESNQFIPSIQMMPNHTEVFTILNKNEIYYIVDDSLLYEKENETGKAASLVLNNGIKLDVSIHKKKPKDQSRILDHLSKKEQFLEFIIGSSIIYINRNCISKIVCTD